MGALRVTQRLLLLALHTLFGLLVTPFIVSGRSDGITRTHPHVASWWHNRLADILGVRITVSGHRPKAPALLVSNHVSWLDIIVLGGLTHTDFLSKHEVREWPVIGWLAARAGTLFIRRGDGQAGSISDQIAARLRQDGLLTLFPEGTTTDGREVRPFFSRLFAAAVDTATDVIPVALRYHVGGDHDPVAPYTGDQSLADNLRGLLRRERTEVHVAFGAPIALRGHSRKEIAELARSAIVAALQSPEPAPLRQRAPITAAGQS
jgi:1-acyl-sn-glycerol-3-phosphate acyltransferase